MIKSREAFNTTYNIYYTTDYTDRDVIHGNFDQPVISDRWMVLHVQSCVRAVTATHLVMSELCEKIGRKQKEPRRSQSSKTRS